MELDKLEIFFNKYRYMIMDDLKNMTDADAFTCLVYCIEHLLSTILIKLEKDGHNKTADEIRKQFMDDVNSIVKESLQKRE